MEPRIEYMALDEIFGADLNPKDHDIGQIIQSIKRFNFTAPLILNEDTNKLVAGHGRLEALIRMFQSQYQIPKGIRTNEEGMWLVPVLRGLDFENEEEAMTYLIADNKLSEFGGWDEHSLAAILDTVKDNLDGVGFDESDIQAIFENLNETWEQDNTDRGLGDPRIKYRLVFDSTVQQTYFFKFLEYLKNTSDLDSVAARLTEYCLGVVDE